MLFLYSRKPQLLLLFCWGIAIAGLFAYATGNQPLFFLQKAEDPAQSAARLGELPPPPEPPAPPAPPVAQPVVPPPEPAPPPAPPPEPEPATGSTLNRATGFRVFPAADGDENKLVLELDYIPAQANGFNPDRAHHFYTADAPTLVIVLGSPWETEISSKTQVLHMKQATRVDLWMMASERQLRIVTHTRTFAEAAGAKVRLARTQTGLRAEIHFTR
ncbi:MAG: hypothetical protein LBB52_03945 [Desulfovibrio sp.]|nr:hypothetical protein [Desulfovibrio sp.]